MAHFGEAWKDYQERIAFHWKDLVGENDLVLLAGDLSWAMKLEDALIDLKWIDNLPGEKILIKGNHDPWWSSRKKMESVLPPSMRAIFTDPIEVGSLSIGGTRLWDHPLTFCPTLIEWCGKDSIPSPSWTEHDEKIFLREMERMRSILKKMPSDKTKIIMTHYPPLHPSLEPSTPCSELFEQEGVSVVVFGHLHNLKKGLVPFGEKNGINYLFTAADYLEFQPLKILSF